MFLFLILFTYYCMLLRRGNLKSAVEIEIEMNVCSTSKMSFPLYRRSIQNQPFSFLHHTFTSFYLTSEYSPTRRGRFSGAFWGKEKTSVDSHSIGFNPHFATLCWLNASILILERLGGRRGCTDDVTHIFRSHALSLSISTPHAAFAEVPDWYYNGIDSFSSSDIKLWIYSLFQTSIHDCNSLSWQC